jgi:hypothetical protein
MTEYLCLTLLSKPSEPESAFKSRLASFWTQLLRTRPDNYLKVYAEASKFRTDEDRVSRQYMVEVDGVDVLLADLVANEIAYEPVEREDTYSKYEATSPDWFQIPH